MNTCLLLVDFQNDYFPGGNMELVGIEEAAAHAQILLHEFRRHSRWGRTKLTKCNNL